jgi:hypothetical protein
MNHPPASERDYWDQILKLAKDNGGSFTLDQIHEEFDLSSREIKKIAKLVERKSAYVAIYNYEFTEDAVKGWGADTLPEERAEKEKPSPDFQRIEGFGELWLMARREFKLIDIDDEEAVQAIRLKYSTLNKIRLSLQHKGIFHGWL